jgi:hypothetical protein
MGRKRRKHQESLNRYNQNPTEVAPSGHTSQMNKNSAGTDSLILLPAKNSIIGDILN